MKRLYSLLMILCIIAMSTFTAGAADGQENSRKPIKYRFDVETRTLTEVPPRTEFSKSTADSPVKISEASPEYNPYSDSLPPPEIFPHLILGSWMEINPATAGRYRNTVFISLNLPNGETARGSGFMIGPSAVATAAHVIYNDDFGGDNFATSAAITPAKANDSAPYGTAYAKTFIIYDEWTDKRNSEYDWAIIELDRNIGDSVGYLGLRWQSASYNNQSISINSYPAYLTEDKTGEEKFTMYFSSGSISNSKTRMLESKNTSTNGGSSGAPVYFYSSSTGYTAIGLVRGGIRINGVRTNQFVRITEEVYDEFIAYRNVRV